MSMIFKNFFKKTRNSENVVYSCVVDDAPKFYLQGYYFVLSLVNIANVDGKRIFIHMITKNPSFERLVSEYGVNIVYVEPWGDKKYCNKLSQLDNPALLKAEYVFFCDADVCIVDDLAKTLPLDKFVGKIVDFDNPSLAKLKQVYKLFDAPLPEENTDTLNKMPTFIGNFNGGLYGIPGKNLKKFGEKWKFFAAEILKSQEHESLLKEKMIHADQIAFSLAFNALSVPYQLLSYEMNCPTHVKDLKALSLKLNNSPSVIHYHSNLTTSGMLSDIKLELVSLTVKKINKVIGENFNNELFWNYRYNTNPELGSGVGSRGEVAEYKTNLLKILGIEADKSILDVGCGDLEIMSRFCLKNYTGVDVSKEALKHAKQKFTNSRFYSYVTEKSLIPSSDTVICLDVAIHQPSKNDYFNLISNITEKTERRLIVSGYDYELDKSNMCFFHEPLKKSLEDKNKFKYIFKVACYRNLAVYLADNGELSKRDEVVSNDISNNEIDEYLNKYNINQDLLLSAVVVSRTFFGWFTKHKPRMIEYPWLLEKFSFDMTGLKVVDFGAGVTPLPIMLAQRNATVFTVDNNKAIRHQKDLLTANEWGYFDYSVLFPNIIGINESFNESTFKENDLDFFYSISVIEHMPANDRRLVISNLARSLKSGGKVFLTVDLCKKSENLWNMAAGQVVEEAAVHGTLDELINELRNVGLTVTESKVIRLEDVERVDLALVSAMLEQSA